MTEQRNKVSTQQDNPAMDQLINILAEKVAEIIKSSSPRPYLSIEEAESYTNLSGSTLRNRVREGKLKKRRNGARIYFLREDLDRMMVGESEMI
jgi:excisionase family DNA binding protein